MACGIFMAFFTQGLNESRRLSGLFLRQRNKQAGLYIQKKKRRFCGY